MTVVTVINFVIFTSHYTNTTASDFASSHENTSSATSLRRTLTKCSQQCPLYELFIYSFVFCKLWTINTEYIWPQVANRTCVEITSVNPQQACLGGKWAVFFVVSLDKYFQLKKHTGWWGQRNWRSVKLRIKFRMWVILQNLIWKHEFEKVLKSVEKHCTVTLHVKKFGCLISDTSFFVADKFQTRISDTEFQYCTYCWVSAQERCLLLGVKNAVFVCDWDH